MHSTCVPTRHSLDLAWLPPDAEPSLWCKLLRRQAVSPAGPGSSPGDNELITTDFWVEQRQVYLPSPLRL